MDWLNYHHLYYFWSVGRTGSVVAACEELGLQQPTVSAQIRQLERALGEKLFEKKGRGLVLTEVGQFAYEYADEIFSIGREFMSAIKQRPSGRALRLHVGLSDAVPKLVASRILKPVMTATDQAARLTVHEGKTESLLGLLATHRVDVVLADEPAPSSVAVRAYSHALGESSVSFFASSTLARKLARNFPQSIDGAPAVLPAANSPLGRALARWFAENRVQPRVIAECEDNALVKTLARDGLGVVAAPTVVADDVTRTFRLKRIGEADGCTERFYAISAERRLKNPAIVYITSQAREGLFEG